MRKFMRSLVLATIIIVALFLTACGENVRVNGKPVNWDAVEVDITMPDLGGGGEAAAENAPEAEAPAADAAGGGGSDACLDDAVSASRTLVYSRNAPGWVKLVDGPPAQVDFNSETIGTVWFGGDVFLTVKNDGEEMGDVIAGTFRPTCEGWDLETVRKMEVEFHEDGGANPACLRDATDGDKPLTSICSDFVK